MRTLCLFLAVASGAALQIESAGSAAATRRSIVKAAIAAPFIVAAPALAITPAEAAGRSFSDGSKKLGANAFVGTYSDPSHSGCKRTISYAGGRSYQIDGSDEDLKPWKVTASRSGSATLLVDFSPKGGPQAVVATQVFGGDLKFPDGNVWKKVA